MFVDIRLIRQWNFPENIEQYPQTCKQTESGLRVDWWNGINTPENQSISPIFEPYNAITLPDG